MICNYCFSNEQIKQYIEENGDEAEQNHQCQNCQEINNDDLIEPMYVLEKLEIIEKSNILSINIKNHAESEK